MVAMWRGRRWLGWLALLVVAAGPRLCAQDLAIRAEVMLEDYRRNEIVADEKYKNKSILVWGIVKRIAETDEENDNKGPFTVWLGAIPKQKEKDAKPVVERVEEPTVACYFNRGKKELLMKLQTGQLVAIKGRGRGGGPILEACTF